MPSLCQAYHESNSKLIRVWNHTFTTFIFNWYRIYTKLFSRCSTHNPTSETKLAILLPHWSNSCRIQRLPSFPWALDSLVSMPGDRAFHSNMDQVFCVHQGFRGLNLWEPLGPWKQWNHAGWILWIPKNPGARFLVPPSWMKGAHRDFHQHHLLYNF